MTLLAGFSYPWRDAQYTFRRILKAMSEPGVVVSLDHDNGWDGLSSSATAVVLTLMDRETPLWLDPVLSQEVLLSNLRFHTGVKLVEREAAAFALLPVSRELSLAGFAAGDEMAPENSATLVLEVPALGGGRALRLIGPGIAEARMIAPQLPASVLDYLEHRPHAFPAGLDFLFTCGSTLMALPRTTHVEVC
ncbi:phosphonate C-P lyase system protein PhnH [Dickeya dianthicola]|uniref:phosphonate C-P lyase system protein PhnH n=1 Tax=Dickeya dianthicola TaxID=204039 RepID=UPI00136A02D5|nr:phosphonate C-P lyase system protein PhnH [Dickeya dianthicola]MCI4214768.1 phosphonate C-P lyase system protein PhnH [Dickeya dianthicola]MCI4226735.1 phosphonate C-P lyase system protein PhnH [Dickeya dianthicola]MCI4232037.1 phosphonate C-P lyase system protein PhnH [Dickeya dianthicola]MZG43210.1 phosphonate C-P lyase system protein PhnH [Dickeya dianthicola]